MRLTPKEVEIIKNTFRQCFLKDDEIYLFGSRVDDAKRGGDIDLLIKTSVADTNDLVKRKLKFVTLLQEAIGEQKIDVILYYPQMKEKNSIMETALNTGIKL